MDYIFFSKSTSPFSNWYLSNFEAEGHTFNCAEQYLMWLKSKLFEDEKIASQILNTLSPKDQKALGRKVKNFDEKIWNKNREKIMQKVLFAKFSSSDKLKQTLLNTEDKILVEASPWDAIWGIGMDEKDALKSKQKWGLNLLGKSLMAVRNQLKLHSKSNWLIPGRIMVGAEPLEKHVKMIKNAGIDTFVSLVEDENKDENKDEENIHFPMPTGKTVSDEKMISFIDKLYKLYKNGSNLYIHCKGGIGRTGLVSALLLAKIYKIPGDEALKIVRKQFETREDQSRSFIPIPETKVQIEQLKRLAGGSFDMTKYSPEYQKKWQAKLKSLRKSERSEHSSVQEHSNIENLSPEKFKEYLNETSLTKLQKLKSKLDDLYYNTGDSTFPDDKYDLLKDFIAKKGIAPSVGAKLRDGENRVELPYWLGSADKITPEDPKELEKWIKNNHAKMYVMSEKLDGVSCLLVKTNKNIKLYTRGDGEIGADISYIAPYLNIPDFKENIAIRGELIISKKTFEKKYLDKVVNGRSYKNSRNMVSGLVGAKTAREGLQDIQFITYEIISEDDTLKPSEQFQKLEKLNFKTAKHEFFKFEDLDMDFLLTKLIEFKDASKFEIDGIIVQSDVVYDRNTSGNPDYMFAFKAVLEGSTQNTTVKKVEWKVSKWGKLNPTIVFDTIKTDGVDINRATAFHAQFVKENKIGPGAIVSIIRSGQVIPYIAKVVKGAKAQFPDTEYVWDKNNVFIYATEFDNSICVRLISNFFSSLGIKFVSEETVRKMFENGLNDLFKILKASKDRLQQIPTIQEASASRIYDNIHNGLKNVKKTSLIGASGVLGYGIGTRKVEDLFLAIPNILELYKTIDKSEMKRRINSIQGFSDITTNKIVKNLKYADKFIEKMSKYATFKESKKISSSLNGEKIVMTGFRDASLKEEIEARGGKVMSSVSGNTTIVITKQKTEKLTGKLEKAQELGTKIYDKEKFIKKYLS